MAGKKETQVATTSGNAGVPAKIDPALMSGWGGMEGVDAADVLVPKLLLMQPISELVAEGKVQAGTIVRSTTGEVLGGKKGPDDAPVKFIPLLTFKDWTLMERVGQKFEFRGREPFTAANRDLPWTFAKGNVEWQRNANINVFALLPSDIARNIKARKLFAEQGELPSPEDSLMPVLLQFTRTSFTVGRGVATHFMQAADLGVPAALTTLSVYTEFVKGDKGSYYVFKLGARDKTPPEYIEAAKRWYMTLSKAQAKVTIHDDDETQAASPADARHDQAKTADHAESEYAGQF